MTTGRTIAILVPGAALCVVAVSALVGTRDPAPPDAVASPQAVLLFMGLPPDAAEVSPFSGWTRRGDRPATAWRSFAVPQDARGQVRRFFRLRCRAAGMAPAEPTAQDPDRLCGGASDRALELSFRCRLYRCRTYVRVDVR